MAFDGITIAALTKELNKALSGARISKIAQPEADALLITCKAAEGSLRLALSANASLPYIYLTETNKPGPLQAPTFCMVLRKHIAGGRIASVTQPGLERIIRVEIEHLNEMGDPCRKYLIAELMGKHSNIIFCDEDGTIIDSIKHVSAAMSSVRQVLPGRQYFIAGTQEEKANPLALVAEGDSKSVNTSVSIDAVIDTEPVDYHAVRMDVVGILSAQPTSICKAIYSSYTGISPLIANEVAYRAGLDGDAPIASLSQEELMHLSDHFLWMMQDVAEGKFSPVIIREDEAPVEFAAVELTQYADLDCEHYESVSRMLESYYAQKDFYTRIRQKSADLRHVLGNLLDRNYKKYQLQQKQLVDTEKREKYRVYGELLQAYGYGLPEGAKVLEAPNYYDDNKIIKIPLDPTMTPQENAKKYFDRYGKLKRTYEASVRLVAETKAEIDHLESIQNALDIAQNADDLAQIKEEMTESGYIRRHGTGKKKAIKSKPLHYRTADGYDIYVGKNNYQNDQLTFHLAEGNDWWFHAKGMPGSHVVAKTGGDGQLPDHVFEEAAALAGYYSKGKNSEKLEIDYLQKKNVKKPNGSAPGFVVYYTNYSMTIKPEITGVEVVE